MSDIGDIGVDANQLPEILELTPDDKLVVVNSPQGNWQLAAITRDNARTSLGGGGSTGGSGGDIDAGSASSLYGGTTILDGGLA